jgi:hypothetical protein
MGEDEGKDGEVGCVTIPMEACWTVARTISSPLAEIAELNRMIRKDFFLKKHSDHSVKSYSRNSSS